MVQIEFITGDADDDTGWPGSVTLDVAYISEFPRGADGACAFCHGDPCAEYSPSDSPIARFFSRNRARAINMGMIEMMPETCPCCDGRPT
jgi:hypothetical protein